MHYLRSSVHKQTCYSYEPGLYIYFYGLFQLYTNKKYFLTQTHKVNLKPAHLSYKCTVCSATFNLYRLFENHVYMVHSGAVKRNSNEDTAGQPPLKKAALDSMVAAANGN